MDNIIENISVFHSSIKIKGSKTIYFDPFKITDSSHDADYIFITHSHYDHFSKEDIEKVINDNTIIVAPKSMENEVDFSNKCVFVSPQETYNENDIEFSTVHAYNIMKPFHPKKNNWLGYIVKLDDINYYVAGDTDITDEAMKVKCDVALIPCGGTYTMNAKEASKLANTIKPQIAIPTHYGAIVGDKKDGVDFVNSLDTEIKGVILIK